MSQSHSRSGRIAVAVDDELVWVMPQPTLRVGEARASSPAQLQQFTAQLDAELEATAGLSLEQLIASVVQNVAAALGSPPPLPFIGDPFGGEGGTD